MDAGKIKFQFPVYPNLELLPRDNRVYACWYYYTLAQKLAEKLGDGSTEAQFGILEGELWMEPRYEQIARTVAMMYGFSSPDEFLKEGIWEVVEYQALALGLPQPATVIKKPLRLVLPT